MRTTELSLLLHDAAQKGNRTVQAMCMRVRLGPETSAMSPASYPAPEAAVDDDDRRAKRHAQHVDEEDAQRQTLQGTALLFLVTYLQCGQHSPCNQSCQVIRETVS